MPWLYGSQQRAETFDINYDTLSLCFALFKIIYFLVLFHCVLLKSLTCRVIPKSLIPITLTINFMVIFFYVFGMIRQQLLLIEEN